MTDLVTRVDSAPWGTRDNPEGWTDEELIAAGRESVGVIERECLWLGRLALAFAPMGDPSRKSGVYERLAIYAEAIGVAHATLLGYRNTAAGWLGVDGIEALPFGVLRALASVPDKRKALEALEAAEPPSRNGQWTANDARELVRGAGLAPVAREPRPVLLQHKAASLVRAADIAADLRRINGDLERVELTEEDVWSLRATINAIEHEAVRLRARIRAFEDDE